MSWMLTYVLQQSGDHFLIVGYATSCKKFRAYNVCAIRWDPTIFIPIRLHLGVALSNGWKHLSWSTLLAVNFLPNFCHISHCSTYFFHTYATPPLAICLLKLAWRFSSHASFKSIPRNTTSWLFNNFEEYWFCITCSRRFSGLLLNIAPFPQTPQILYSFFHD